jgi:predicted TIM-barrel fold metal-dependent hydrolase
MLGGLSVFDADSHVMEPADFWERYIDPEFRERAPRGDSRFRQALTVDGRQAPTMRYKRREERADRIQEDQLRRYGDYSGSGWDAPSYVRMMDREGIDRMAVYPTRGLYQASAWGLDPALCAAVVRAYNSWLHDFCAPDRTRLVGVGQLDLREVGGAIREARRCVGELGFGGVFAMPTPPLPGVTLERPYYDPLWSALEELDVPLGIHDVPGVGTGQVGADRFGDWVPARAATAFTIESQVALFSLLMGGICERHPGLRVVVLESGAGWLPYWLWYLDELAERYASELPPLSLRPSEYFRRQCFISGELEEPTLKYVVDYLGCDNAVVATDFPHPEATFPGGVRAFLGREDLGAEAKRMLLWDNPRRLYKLD